MGRSGYNHDDSEDGDCSSAADSRATEPDRDSSRADRLVGLRSLYREIRGMIIALGPRQPEIKLDGSFRSVGDSLNGNPRLAALMATDPVFLIVRRYRYLQARLLLHIQEDLNSYETELDRLDREQLSATQPGRKESERGDDLSEEQRRVLEKVSASLAQYGQVASLVQQFDKYDEPSTSRLRSLQNFFEVNKPFGNDKSYYRHKNDLMVLRDMKSDTFIDRTFVHPLLERPGKFLKVFSR
ncbi:hypothetical protein ANO14919_145430 [Xylariales sp. No.14919]|nr:hypothetical protein ANO14919_145430 [Xylariales sp. No.14919]